MGLTVDQALDVLRREVQSETERDKLFVLAHNNPEFVARLKENEVVRLLTHLQEQPVGQKRTQGEARLEGRLERVEEKIDGVQGALKKAKTSVTNVVELGGQVLDDADAVGQDLFKCRQFASHEWVSLGKVATALIKPYEQLKALSAQRQNEGKTPKEEPVQAFSKTLYEVFQAEHQRGRTVIGDTSATGLGGGKNKIDLVICEGVVALPHVVFGHENKPTMSKVTHQKEAAGQLKQRNDQILAKQRSRTVLTGVAMGFDEIDIWVFEEGRKTVHTGPLPFAADARSAGLQALWRLWRTPDDVLGYRSPALPSSVKMVSGEGSFREGTLITDLSQLDVADSNGTSRTTAEVLCGTLTGTGEKVALKTGTNIDDEIANMNNVRGLELEGVIEYCGIASSDDGRKWLVTAPVGSPIIEGGDPRTIVERFAFFARTVGKMYDRSGFLHRDLSYGNLISTKQGPRIIDWGTVQHVDSQSQDATEVTGTPLFMAISTLRGAKASVSSELESLGHILAHIATGDGLHWRHELFGSYGMVDAKYAGWTLRFEEKMLPKIDEEVYELVVRRLQALFFPKCRYRTDVTVDEFLNALQLEV